ncbi:MAG: hypothetical protein AAGF86_20715 [Pseudomonadota bacterium]
MRYALLIALLAFPAAALSAATAVAADEREVFYGTWGTPKQCARAPIKPGGTVLAEPFEIDAEWLRQGRFWCRLSWYPIEQREDGFFTGARAQCGEDSVRGYSLGMVLSGDKLTLRWDFPRSNGPLALCPRS